MIFLPAHARCKAILIPLLFACLPAVCAGEWTEPVEVRMEVELCVSYRAKLDGDLLVVEAAHAGEWHTYAMDNKLRAEEKLAGKPSLGIDAPTEIELNGGLEIAGPWRQSEPIDLSKPELRWFTWGYSEPALFVAKVKRVGDGPARIGIRGQACDASRCKNIEVELLTPLGGAAGAVKGDYSSLIEVRTAP